MYIHAKLLDVLTSLPVSHAILPRAMRFIPSRPANHAICSFVDLSGYASGPIRVCLFINYIIMFDISHLKLSIDSIGEVCKNNPYHMTWRLGVI